MNDKEKQINEIVEARENLIEEMARVMCDDCRPYSHGCKQNLCDSIVSSAETLYCAGYRKQTEGEWIVTKTERGWNCAEYPSEYTCSICGRTEPRPEPYCHCGAKMKGGAE